MKSSFPLFVIMVIWVTTMAPMCKFKQVKDTVKSGKEIVEEIVKNKPKKPIFSPQPKPPINLMPILSTAKVVFNVVDATGKKVNLINPALQAELSAAQVIDAPRLVQIVQKVRWEIALIRKSNNGELSKEQEQLAFKKIFNEIKNSKGLYSFAFGMIFYRKQSNINSNYYIVASESV